MNPSRFSSTHATSASPQAAICEKCHIPIAFSACSSFGPIPVIFFRSSAPPSPGASRVAGLLPPASAPPAGAALADAFDALGAGFEAGFGAAVFSPVIRATVSPRDAASATEAFASCPPVNPSSEVSPPSGSEAKRPFCGPGAGTSPRASASRIPPKLSAVRSS